MNEINLPARIARGEDGICRWTYEISSENKSMLKTYMIIFALIILIPGFILMFMIYGNRGYWSGFGTFLLIWAAIFAGVELLTVLIYKAVEKSRGGTTPIPYSMNDEMIMLHRDLSEIDQIRARTIPYILTEFANITDIDLDAPSDLILLHEPLRVTHVYVPKEDLPFVLNFILDRIPQTDKIARKRLSLTSKLG